MRIIEGKYLEIRQTVEIEHFFEATYFIATDIEVIERYQMVKTSLDRIDLITSNPKLFQTNKGI